MGDLASGAWRTACGVTRTETPTSSSSGTSSADRTATTRCLPSAQLLFYSMPPLLPVALAEYALDRPSSAPVLGAKQVKKASERQLWALDSEIKDTHDVRINALAWSGVR